MGGLFSKPSMPIVQQAPITTDTAEVKEAAKAEADRLRKRRGVKSTILTGPAGITEPAGTYKTTLG